MVVIFVLNGPVQRRPLQPVVRRLGRRDNKAASWMFDALVLKIVQCHHSPNPISVLGYFFMVARCDFMNFIAWGMPHSKNW